jgi:murein DD-endopeptidase MepM/ murein hydrolase activator NlpD
MNSGVFRQVVGILALLVLVSGGLIHPVPATAASKWDWPMKYAQLSVGFDRPPQNWLPGHRGVDLVGKSGDQVLAAGNGVVAFAGTVAGKGVVVIKHGSLRTTYEPVSALVLVGSKVRVGELIGRLTPGQSHCATPTTVSCLHWGLLRGEKYLNPLALVKKQVRLLPTLSAVFMHPRV